MNELFNWAKQNQAIATALVGVLSAILGGLFTTVIWPGLKALAIRCSDLIRSKISRKFLQSRYLEWMISAHQHLPLLPTTLVNITTQGAHQELDRLYISLRLAEDKTKNPNDLSIEAALKKHNRLVILGEPGAGKTTTLRFLALSFARARRNKPIAKLGPEREAERHRIRATRKRLLQEFSPIPLLIPIFVYLNRLGEAALVEQSPDLLAILRKEWKALPALRDVRDDFLAEKIDRGECLFLFDAFDELGTQEKRDRVARLVGDFANAAGNNKFIVTSRIVGYSGQLVPYGFHALTIQRMSRPLVEDLVTKWYIALNNASLGEDLLRTLRANEHIYELAENPMLLSLIALVQYVRQWIPDRRHLLYEECIRILVERRFAGVPIREGYDSVLPGHEALRILQKLAMELHSRHLREMPRTTLEEDVLKKILASMKQTKAVEVAPADILRNIEERSQLLVERGFDQLGRPLIAFSHTTFQEYLTSVALKESTATRGLDGVNARLIADCVSDRDWWEEVALLYAAQLDPDDQEPFLQQLYPEHESIGRNRPRA
jgi:predicted NACHT family NTPase